MQLFANHFIGVVSYAIVFVAILYISVVKYHLQPLGGIVISSALSFILLVFLFPTYRVTLQGHGMMFFCLYFAVVIITPIFLSSAAVFYAIKSKNAV